MLHLRLRFRFRMRKQERLRLRRFERQLVRSSFHCCAYCSHAQGDGGIEVSETFLFTSAPGSPKEVTSVTAEQSRHEVTSPSEFVRSPFPARRKLMTARETPPVPRARPKAVL
jgi:hypothetical protein